MANNRQVSQRAAPDSGVEPFTTTPISEIGNLAQFACAAAAAKGCLLSFRSSFGEGCIWATSTGSARQLRGAQVTELAARWDDGEGGATPITHRLAASDGAVLRSLGIEIEDAARLTLSRHHQGHSTIFVVLVSAAAKTTKAVAELVARCMSALIGGHYHSNRAIFWRTQAGKLRDSLIAAREQAARTTQQHFRAMAANRRLVSNAERGNLPALASALSKLGPFDGWILATQDRDGLQIRAARGVPRDAVGERANEFGRLLQRRVTVARNVGAAPGSSAEERLFRSFGYRSYLSVPMEGAALLLLARNPLTAAARARVVNALTTVGPHLRSLFLSRELERQRALVRSLVRGLFETADAERASLRRDLHDDWAQLLAAAQIALNGNGEDARRLFRELEGELRKRLDTLRPPPSRRGNLKRTIDAELQRLRQAGIHATTSIHGHNRLPATIREVFTRVIGEGVSNVIRHAGADRVHIEVECRDGLALAAITDNGRGAGNRAAAAGSGLRGLAERVAMVGGSCELDAKPGGTRLCARIPLADL